MLIDAHQHFWSLARGDYDWLTPDLSPLYRDFQPADLEAELRSCGIDATVLVQAAPTVAETRYMLELADTNPYIRAVVGWVDFADAEATLIDFAAHPKFKGVRPMLQDLSEADWILQPAFNRTFCTLVALDLAFDALVRTEQLPAIRNLCERHPDLRIVVDHAAKPDIAGGSWEPWASELAALAVFPNACCKLSGLLTQAGPDPDWERVGRYAEEVLRLFGPNRVLWGSDWPVLNLAGSYRKWFDFCCGLGLPNQVFGRNAARFYRLEDGW